MRPHDVVCYVSSSLHACILILTPDLALLSRWRARIGIDGVETCSLYATEHEAARAYDVQARRVGRRTNFDDGAGEEEEEEEEVEKGGDEQEQEEEEEEEEDTARRFHGVSRSRWGTKDKWIG